MKFTTFLLVCVCGVLVPRICTADSQEEVEEGGSSLLGSRCERAGGRCLVGQWAWCSAHLSYNDCPAGTSCCLEPSSGEMNKTWEASLGRKVLQLSPRTIENRGIRGSIEDEAPRTRKSRKDKRGQHNGGNSRGLRRPNERRRKNEKSSKEKVNGKLQRRKSGDKRSGHLDGKQVKRRGKKYSHSLGPGEQRQQLNTVKKKNKKKTMKYRKMQEKKRRVKVDYIDDDGDDDDQLPANTKKHHDKQRVKPIHKHTPKKKQGKNKACQQASKCGKKDGTCKKSCLKNENEVKGCKRGCRCCSSSSSSSSSSSGGCKVMKACKNLGGACKTSCSSRETDAGKGCKGRNCRCCVAGGDGGKCKPRSVCEDLKGTCKKLCSPTEVLIPDGCQGAACHCCVPEIVGCPSSSECPGRCMSSCPGVLSTATCLGASCSCCLNCQSSPACREAHGVCRAECSCGEKELRDGCSGNGCKCCIADVPARCSGGSRCSGECVYGPLCTGAVLSNVTCSDQAGCACCTRE